VEMQPLEKFSLGKSMGAVDVGGEAMRCERLAIGEDRKLCVHRAAGLGQIGCELAIESFSARKKSGVLRFRGDKHSRYGDIVALPVRAQLAAQVYSICVASV